MKELRGKIIFGGFRVWQLLGDFTARGLPSSVSLRGISAMLIFRGASEQLQSEAIAAAKEQGWVG